MNLQVGAATSGGMFATSHVTPRMCAWTGNHAKSGELQEFSITSSCRAYSIRHYLNLEGKRFCRVVCHPAPLKLYSSHGTSAELGKVQSARFKVKSLRVRTYSKGLCTQDLRT